MSARLWIRCGTLLDGSGGPPRHDATVEIVGDRIRSVGLDEPARRDGMTLDWRAHTVLPGLVDAHDHLTLDVGDEELQSREPSLWTALRGAGNAQRILRAGVTTVRDCGAKAHVDLRLRTAIVAGLIEGPRLLVSGTPLTIVGGQCWFLGGAVDSPAGIRRLVREQIDAGVDFIKVFVTGGVATRGTELLRAQFSDDELRLVVEEAHAGGRPVIAHCHGGPGARAAIAARVDSIEHGVFLAREDLEAMAAYGIPLVVTFGVYERLAASAELEPAAREQCEKVVDRYVETIAAARDVKVTIAVGTDTVHADLAAELRALIQAGFTPLEAVVAATAHGASVCGLADAGRVEPGMRADVLAVRGDPLADVSALRDVAHLVQDGAPRW